MERAQIILDVKADGGMKSLRQMKQEMRELQIAMSKASDPTEFKRLEAEFAKLRNDMKDTSAAMQYLDPGELLGGWVKMTQGVVGSFAAITGAMSLFGNESEKIQEIEKKSMALIQTMMGLEQMRQLLVDQGSKAQLKALVQNTSAQITYALSLKTVDKVTGEVVIKQNLWNKAMKSAPIFLLITAVAGLTVGLAALYNASRKQASEQEVLNDLMDTATEDIGKNTAVLEIHVKRLQSAYGNQDEFNKAVKDWNNNIAGKYSNTLLTTSSNLDDIARAAEEARSNIIKMGIASAAQEKISEIYADNFDYILKYQDALDQATQMQQKAADIDAKIKEEMTKNARFATTEEFRNLASQSQVYKETAENLRTYGNLQEKTTTAAITKGKDAYNQVQQLLNIVDEYTVAIDDNSSSTSNNTKEKEKEIEKIDKLISKYKSLSSLVEEEPIEIAEIRGPELRTPEEISAEYAMEIASFEETTKTKLEILKYYHEQGIISEKDYQRTVALLIQEQVNKYADYISTITDNLSSVFSNLTEMAMIEIEKQDYAWQQSYDERSEALNTHLEDVKRIFGEESQRYKDLLEEQKKMDEEKAEHDKKIAAEKKVAEQKYAKFQIGAQMAEATATFAQGVAGIWAQALATQGPFGAITATALTALLTATYGTQMALMIKQLGAVGKMKQGGLITGPSHEAGGVLKELEGGEFVINARAMSVPGMRSLASQMNSIGSRNETSPIKIDTSGIADAVTSAIKSIPVTVLESDITKTQQRVKLIQTKNTL